MKAAIVFLVLLAVGLGAGLVVRHKQATEIKADDEQIKTVLSNRVDETQALLDEKEKLAMVLQTNLTLKSEELSLTSNNLTKIANDLAADLARTQKKMQQEAEAARAEIERRDQQISQLTSQTNQLTMKMDDLTSSIDKLSKNIGETERKLSASEGDREFLLKELKRLQAEKADLEKQFSDLSVLRTQISKLKDELSVARRLEWIRMGIYGMQDKKGAERLMNPSTPSGRSNNFNLNVELRQDTGATIVAPKTNAPGTR